MGWTLDEAKDMLRTWLDAERAVSTGQEYRINGRSVTRANLSEIADRIKFWRAEVNKLQSGRKGRKVIRVVPRDL